MITLGQLRAGLGRIVQITKVCSTSAEFAQLINDAQERLLRRGDWVDTVVPIFVCVRQGCVVWPRYVGQVRAVNICNRPMPVRNLWYDYLPGAKGCGAWNGGQWYGASSWATGWGGYVGPQVQLAAKGRSPVFQDIMGDGRLVRVYARCNADYGKTVQIFGTDNNGQPLMTEQSDGTWTDGVTITLAAPFGTTSVFVRHIDYVIKEVTQCPMNMYAYNATTDLLEDLAQYDAGETVPSYLREQLSGAPAWSTYCGSCSGASTPSSCASLTGVAALVKLEYIPAVADTDLIIVDNPSALKKEIISIIKEEAGELAMSKAYEQDAVHELNRGMENESPDSQFSASNNVLGTAVWRNRSF